MFRALNSALLAWFSARSVPFIADLVMHVSRCLTTTVLSFRIALESETTFTSGPSSICSGSTSSTKSLWQVTTLNADDSDMKSKKIWTLRKAMLKLSSTSHSPLSSFLSAQSHFWYLLRSFYTTSTWARPFRQHMSIERVLIGGTSGDPLTQAPSAETTGRECLQRRAWLRFSIPWKFTYLSYKISNRPLWKHRWASWTQAIVWAARVNVSCSHIWPQTSNCLLNQQIASSASSRSGHGLTSNHRVTAYRWWIR